MNARALLFLLPSGVAAGVATSLVDAGLKSGVLLLLAAVAAVAFRKSAAATRHVIWTAAVAGALAMPILSLSLPQWRVLPSWMGPEPAPRASGTLSTLPPPLPAISEVSGESASSAQGGAFAIQNDVVQTANYSQIPAPAAAPMLPIPPAFSRGMAVLFGWAIGAALLLLLLLQSAWSLRRLSRGSEIVTAGVLVATVKAVAHELRLRREITIHIGPADAMPIVWGVWRAHLLLPSSAERWRPARLRAVLLHELAHVRRRDPLTLLLAQLARAVHWFNPLAWLAVHRLRVEQEQACDDCVLRAGVKPSDYASDVLEIATAARACPAAPSMALSMASPARLEGRLRGIVQGTVNRAALAGWVVAVAFAAAVGVALPLAMVRAADRPDAQPPTARAIDPITGIASAETPVGRAVDSSTGISAADAPTERPIDPISGLAAAEKSSLFGPVVERTIYDINGNHPDDSLIDLDSGKLFPESALGPITREEDLLREMAKAKIDLMGDASGQTFSAFAMLILPTGEKFDLLTVERVDQLLEGHAPSDKPHEVKIRKELPATYLFKTREGGRGVFEVLRYNNDYESMDIRYKLVGVRWVFQPIARLILPSAAGSKRFLNLLDGKTYSEEPSHALVAYLERESKTGWHLVVEGAYNYRSEPEQGAKLWESMSAEEIAQAAGLAAVPFERKGFYALHSHEGPRVVLIPEWGLLRIAAIDERTKTVVIEYKQVAAAGQADAGKTAVLEKRRTSRNHSAETQEQLQEADAERERTTKLFQKIHGEGVQQNCTVCHTVKSGGDADTRKNEEQTPRIGARRLDAEAARLEKLQAEARSSEFEWDQAKLAVLLRAAELKGDAAEAARIRLRQAESEVARLTKLHSSKEPEPALPGEAVGGVRTRLHADKAIWKLTETPHLKLEIRNVGDAPLPIPVTQELGELEVDGVLYRWPAKVRGRIPTLDAGETRQVSVGLSSEWRRETGEALALQPGTQTVRFALASAWSNRVTIEIMPKQSAATPGLPVRVAETIDALTGISAHSDRHEAIPRFGAAKPGTEAKEAAHLRLREAEANWEMAEKLYAAKALSKEKLDEAVFAVEIQRAELHGDHKQAALLRLRKAEADLERVTKLYEQKAASREALEDAKRMVVLQESLARGDDGAFARLQAVLRPEGARLPQTETPANAAAPVQRLPLSDTRTVVDEWLGHIAAERTDQMWSLTTREQGGLSLDVSKADAFKSIRANYVLGNETAAMVMSNRYKDNAGRLRVLLCTLVKREGRWLIHEHLYGDPPDIQLRVAGFAAHPGVRYEVRPEDLVGQWRTVFFTGSDLHTFRADGSGTTQEFTRGQGGDVTPFRWEVQGDVYRRHANGKTYDGTIIRIDDAGFGVRYGNGQVGFERAAETVARPAGTNPTPDATRD